MTPEDRKDYNQKYYEKKKDKIKLLCKVACPLCSSQVNHQNLPKHQSTELCRSRRESALSQRLNEMQESLNELILEPFMKEDVVVVEEKQKCRLLTDLKFGK